MSGLEGLLSNGLSEILSFLTDHFRQDFHSYSNSITQKRISERTAKLDLPSLDAYYLHLTRDPAEPPLLARMLRVRFSSFFRDLLQFELLGAAVIPPLLINKSGNSFFRVWCAACAGGEEACSLAMVIDEAKTLLDSKTAVQIFATDIAEDALAEARRGTYPRGTLGEVTLKRLETYFTHERNSYRVKEKIREMITYSRHDLLDANTYAPPDSLFGGFDLISCRNFLMYLDADGYSRVFDNLFRALNPNGVLLLGKAESVPDAYTPHMERFFDCGNFYRKLPKPGRGR